MLNHALDLLKGSWRYTTGLRGFLAVSRDLEDARRLVTNQLQNRAGAFLHVLERGVYANPRSPYRRLLLHAGFEFEDVRALVRELGLEAALTRLHEAGVYVTLDEFKGRASVRRPGLEFAVSDRDFDNPLLTVHYESRTSGSRGGGTRAYRSTSIPTPTRPRTTSATCTRPASRTGSCLCGGQNRLRRWACAPCSCSPVLA